MWQHGSLKICIHGKNGHRYFYTWCVRKCEGFRRKCRVLYPGLRCGQIQYGGPGAIPQFIHGELHLLCHLAFFPRNELELVDVLLENIRRKYTALPSSYAEIFGCVYNLVKLLVFSCLVFILKLKLCITLTRADKFRVLSSVEIPWH